MTYRTSGFPSTELPMQAILSIALPLTATQKGVNTKMANKIDIALCESAKPKTSVISYLIPPSHRRRGATTVFGQNRHHRSDTASSFS